MHRCLQVDEILVHIAQDTAGPQRESIGSLGALAQTCQTFLEPSLSVLWSSQTGLVNLLKCLPEGFVEGNGTIDNLEFCTKASQKQDWKRVRFYAKYIKMLNLCPVSEDPAARAREYREFRHALSALALYDRIEPGRPLFSQLRHLLWRGYNACTLNYLPLFCGSALQFLSVLEDPVEDEGDDWMTLFEMEYGCQVVESALSALPYTSPNLITLNVCVHATNAFAVTLSRCRKLRNLWLMFTPTPFDVMEAVASLPELRNLDLYPDGDYLPDTPWEQEEPAFAQLRHLSLFSIDAEIQDVSTCTSFIKRYRPPVLQSLHVEHYGLEDHQTLTALCRAVVHHLPSTLTVLDIRLEDEVRTLAEHLLSLGDTPPPETVITITAFQPVLLLRNIQHFVLEIPRRTGLRFSMTRDAFESIGRAWPKLQVFELDGRWSDNPGSLPTFDDFRPMLQACPNLHWFGCQFNALLVPDEVQNGLPVPVMNPYLSTLLVGNSPVSDDTAHAELVARALVQMFPSLRALHRRVGLFWPAWGEVQSFLPELRTVVRTGCPCHTSYVDNVA